MSTHAQVADAIVDAINAASLSMTLTAARKVLPQFLLTEITGPRVDVVLGDRTLEIMDRNTGRLRTMGVSAVVQVPVSPPTVADADTNDDLADEIEQVILQTKTVGNAVLVAVETTQPYDPELIASMHLHAWVINAIYKEISR